MTNAERRDQERAAKVIKLATQIMEQGRARGWSDALAQAKQQVR
jgi:hypothetical protein